MYFKKSSSASGSSKNSSSSSNNSNKPSSTPQKSASKANSSNVQPTSKPLITEELIQWETTDNTPSTNNNGFGFDSFTAFTGNNTNI